MTYLIPKRMNEEIKLCSKPVKIYVRDIVTMAVIAMVAWMMAGWVHTYLLVPYVVFVAVSAIYLTRPARDNPGKRNWEAILYLLARLLARPWYASINNPQRRTEYVSQTETTEN